MNILLVGPRRTGKSSTGNTLLGRGQVFETRGGGASTAASATTAGRHISVVDTQAWGLSEDFVPREEKIELLRAMSLFGLGGPHVVLLVIPLTDFTDSERRAVERRMEILTSTVWRHTMVLFTCGDLLRRRGCTVEEHIQLGGPALRRLMEKCRYRYHVFNNKTAVLGEQEVKRGEKQQEDTWRNKIFKGGERTSTREEKEGRTKGEQKQVRELLSKVENMLQENGGWHFSLHMYQRMEEEWSRRELELRTRLAAETDVGGVRTKQEQSFKAEEEEKKCCLRTREDNKMNRWEDEEKKAIELMTLSSEESSERGEERKESTDRKTGMTAPSWPKGGQRLVCSPRRLA